MASFAPYSIAKNVLYTRAPSEIRQLVLDHLSPASPYSCPRRNLSYFHARLAHTALSHTEPEADGRDEDDIEDGPRYQRRPRQSPKGASVRTRTIRSLRPLVYSPVFSKDLLPSSDKTENADSDSPGPSHASAASNSRAHSASLSLANLPSDTTKAVIRPKFIKFGKIENIWVEEGGRNATVTFMEARSVTAALKENASKPLMMGGQEVILWRQVSSAPMPTPVPIPVYPGMAAQGQQPEPTPVSTAKSPTPPSTSPQMASSSASSSNQETKSSARPLKQDETPMLQGEAFYTAGASSQGSGRGRGVLYARDLHRWTTLKELHNTFKSYGAVVAIRHEEQSDHAHILFEEKDDVYKILNLTKKSPLTLRDKALVLEASSYIPTTLEKDPTWNTSFDDPFVRTPSPSPFKALAMRAATELAKDLRNQVPSKPSCTLFVGRLPHGVRPNRLARLFTRLGPVVDLRMSAHRQYARIEYPTIDAAVFALDEAVRTRIKYGTTTPELDFEVDDRTSRRSRTIYINNWPAIDGAYRVPDKEEQKEVARRRQKKDRKFRRLELEKRKAEKEEKRVAKENELVLRAIEKKWVEETIEKVGKAEAEGLLVPLDEEDAVVDDIRTTGEDAVAVDADERVDGEFSQPEVEELDLSDYQEGVVGQPRKARKRGSREPPPEDVEPYGVAQLRGVFKDQPGLQAVFLMPQYGKTITRPAFVVFEDRPQAEKALKALQGVSLPSAAPNVPATDLEMTMSELPYFGPIDLIDLLGTGVQGEFDKLGEWEEWEEVRATSRVMDWEEASQLTIEPGEEEDTILEDEEDSRGSWRSRKNGPKSDARPKSFGLRVDAPSSVRASAGGDRSRRQRGFGFKS